MDESSSRFVDQLVTNKIISEKLSKVRHRPKYPLDTLVEVPFTGFIYDAQSRNFEFEESEDALTIPSPVDCEYEQNRQLKVVVHKAPNPRGAILLLHGLFEDNRLIYGFLISEFIRLGYSVYQPTLPFHYERTPQTSRFSGEFYLSAELHRTKGAFRQAALELQQCYDLLASRLSVPVYVVGFSMGGAVTLTVAGLTNCFSRLCIVNPATKLSELIWTSPLCQTIRDDLSSSGYGKSQVDEALATFDPFSLRPDALKNKRVLMIYGLYDSVTLPRQYEALREYFGLKQVLRYKSGHLNCLRVPRLADDIVRFFDSCRINDGNSESVSK